MLFVNIACLTLLISVFMCNFRGRYDTTSDNVGVINVTAARQKWRWSGQIPEKMRNKSEKVADIPKVYRPRRPAISVIKRVLYSTDKGT